MHEDEAWWFDDVHKPYVFYLIGICEWCMVTRVRASNEERFDVDMHMRKERSKIMQAIWTNLNPFDHMQK